MANGEYTILSGLMRRIGNSFIDFWLKILLKRGADPTLVGNNNLDLIEVLDINWNPDHGYGYTNDKYRPVLLNAINQWEARKYLPIKMILSTGFSCLMTKKIIRYLIHRKADFNKVWKVSFFRNNFGNHGGLIENP